MFAVFVVIFIQTVFFQSFRFFESSSVLLTHVTYIFILLSFYRIHNADILHQFWYFNQSRPFHSWQRMYKSIKFLKKLFGKLNFFLKIFEKQEIINRFDELQN